MSDKENGYAVNVYRVDIEGKDAFELYVVSAERQTLAVEAGLKRYHEEHGEGTARRCRIYTLTGELLIDKFLGGHP